MEQNRMATGHATTYGGANWCRFDPILKPIYEYSQDNLIFLYLKIIENSIKI